jgi:hypothetical protein
MLHADQRYHQPDSGKIVNMIRCQNFVVAGFARIQHSSVLHSCLNSCESSYSMRAFETENLA